MPYKYNNLIPKIPFNKEFILATKMKYNYSCTGMIKYTCSKKLEQVNWMQGNLVHGSPQLFTGEKAILTGRSFSVLEMLPVKRTATALQT